MKVRELKRHRAALVGRSVSAVAAIVDGILLSEDFDDDRDEYDDDEGYDCTHCGGEGYCQVDDPLWDECDEFGYGPCGACHGTGERSQQWVF